MAKKAKKKTFRAATAVKSAARNVIGSPRPTRQLKSKKENSQEKHKKTLNDFLTRDE